MARCSLLLAVVLVLFVCASSAVMCSKDDEAAIRFYNLFSVEATLDFAVVNISIGGVPPFTVSPWVCSSSGSFSMSVSDTNTAGLLYPVGVVPLANGSANTLVCSAQGCSLLLAPAVAPPLRPADTAYVRVVLLGFSRDVTLFNQSVECYNCSMLPLFTGARLPAPYLPVDTRWDMLFQLRDTETGQNLTPLLRVKLGEYAMYTLVARNVTNGTLSVLEDREAAHTYLPLYIAAAVLVTVALMWILLTRFVRTTHFGRSLMHNGSHFVHRYLWDTPCGREELAGGDADSGAGSTNHDQPGASTGGPSRSGGKLRLVSLDGFRGLCITLMIFVNYGGGGYWFFNHSLWNGLTFADLLFPWFIFIMGAAMPIAFAKAHRSPPSTLVYKVLRRSAILFFLGLVIAQETDLKTLRIPGVLQRFAVTYFVVALIVLFVPKLGGSSARERDEQPLLVASGGASSVDLSGYGERPAMLRDLLPYALEWLCVIALIAAHTLITFLLPVPGCPRGYLGPGGPLVDNGLLANGSCTGGAAGYIDRKVFGERHIYDGPTCRRMYQTGSYDPEGLLGCVTSIVLCYFGVQLGRIVQHYKGVVARCGRWVVWGLILGAIGTALCGASQNHGVIPINKNLWSLSFILVMGGTGFILYTLFFLAIDYLQFWNGAPFIYVGRNSITVYMGSELLGGKFPFAWTTNGTHLQDLACNMTGVALWLIIAYYMYVCDFFINV